MKSEIRPSGKQKEIVVLRVSRSKTRYDVDCDECTRKCVYIVIMRKTMRYIKLCPRHRKMLVKNLSKDVQSEDAYLSANISRAKRLASKVRSKSI